MRKKKPNPFHPRNKREFHALTTAQQRRYMESLSALNDMRKQGISFTTAAKQHHLAPKTLGKFIKGALKKDVPPFTPTASDKLLRVLNLPTREGRIEVGTRSARVASLIAEYDAAVKHFLYTGDTASLVRFEGVVINADGTKIELLT